MMSKMRSDLLSRRGAIARRSFLQGSLGALEEMRRLVQASGAKVD